MAESIILFSALAAITPIVIYIAFFWWLDRYEREPLWLLGLTFVYGGIIGIFLGVMGSAYLVRIFEVKSFLVLAGLIAPVTEEPAKGLVLLFLLSSKNFDNTTDGLLYGAVAGLGFAATENFLYFLNAYDAGGEQLWWQLVFVRGLFTALMHSSATATLGAFLGWARYRRTADKRKAFSVGLLLAIGIHAAFNSAVVYADINGTTSFRLAALGLVPLLGLVLFFVTQRSLHGEHRIIVAELREEAERGRIPAEHAEILPFWRRRRRGDWLPKEVDKRAYIKAATKLAFRKHQTRLSPLPSPRLTKDIGNLRREIATHLAAGGIETYSPETDTAHLNASRR